MNEKTQAPEHAITGTEVSCRHAIVLAGGLGTRLRSVVSDLPKCMAPVAGKPFLFYLINYLRLQGIDEFVFSLGYKHEIITAYLQHQFPTLRYETVIEAGTAGNRRRYQTCRKCYSRADCTRGKRRYLVQGRSR